MKYFNKYVKHKMVNRERGNPSADPEDVCEDLSEYLISIHLGEE